MYYSLIKKIRTCFLHGNVFIISERFYVLLSNIKRDILGRKINVKNSNKINISKNLDRFRSYIYVQIE